MKIDFTKGEVITKDTPNAKMAVTDDEALVGKIARHRDTQVSSLILSCEVMNDDSVRYSLFSATLGGFQILTKEDLEKDWEVAE